MPPPSPPATNTTVTLPHLAIEPQPTSSVASDATFHSASEEPFPSNPTTPDENGPIQVNDVFHSPTPNSSNDARSQTSEDTLKKLIGATPDLSVDVHLDVSPSRPSLSRTTTGSSSRGPPQYPARTPARTKRRSVSSVLSEQASPTSNFDKSRVSQTTQDFSALLSTPAPLIFSTPLERDLLNSLSSLGFDTGQIVHSVLTDACDAMVFKTDRIESLVARLPNKRNLLI